MSLDEFEMPSNVIELALSDRRKPIADLSVTTKPVREAVIHNLDVSIRGPVIHWERDTGKYSFARDFFRILAEQSRIGILCEGDSITKASMLSVRDADRSEHELSVDYFIRLTADRPDVVSDIDSYVMTYFNKLGTHMGMRANDSSVTKHASLYKAILCLFDMANRVNLIALVKK